MSDLSVVGGNLVEGFDRARGIGGSDMGAILGVSPFRSEWDVWLEKTRNPAWRPQDESPEMRLGKMLEPVVLDWYREDTNLATIHHLQGGEPTWHENGILFAHIDASTVVPPALVEVKVVRDSRGWAEGPPLHYETQGRVYQTIYREAQYLDFAVLFRADALFQRFRQDRDQTIEDRLVRAAEEWWERRVVRQEPPTVDGSEGAYAYLQSIYPRPIRADLLPYDAQFETMALAYIDTRAAIARMEESKKILANKLRDGMAGHPRAEGIGWHIISNRVAGATTTTWRDVAKAYRRMIEDARAAPTRIAGIKQLSAVDLDAIESMYTSTGDGYRSLVVTEEKSK